MKILVVSDTHARTEQLRILQEQFSGEDIIKIHCGDSELPSHSPLLSGFTVVQGNCDIYDTFPDEAVIERDGIRIFVTHGHQYRVKQTLLPIACRARELNADIICFGHSHFLGVEQSNGGLYVNPGSLNFPRGRVEGSYVIIDVSVGAIEVTAFSDQHDKIYNKTYPR